MKTRFLLFFTIVFISAQVTRAQIATVWGTTISGGTFNGGTLFNMKTDGSDFTVVHDFDPPNGFVPMGNLLQASDGNLYGTCKEGGDSGSCTIFRYKVSTGDYTDVYSFGTAWGDFPKSGVVEKNGILYGNASAGGSFGGGVIYSYNMATGIYADLHNLPMGSTPYNAPTFGYDGKLYGTTVYGGANGSGSIYSFDPSTSMYAEVHDFDGAAGFNPYPGLLNGSNGKLYGMTTYGGAEGKGIIFSFDPSSNTYEKLYDFNGTNGARPKGALMEGIDGALYGLTTIGGVNSEGVIFKFDLTNNTCTKLFDFTSSDGTTPLGNLMQSGNNLSGTTSAGGAYGYGTAFYLDLQSGSFTKVVDFDGTNGASPSGGLIMLSNEVGTGVQTPGDNHFTVYPNPVTNYAICTLSSAGNSLVTVKVSDASGKEVLFQNLEAKNSEVRIDLNDLKPGAYVLEVMAGTEKKSAKIMKQ